MDRMANQPALLRDVRALVTTERARMDFFDASVFSAMYLESPLQGSRLM